MDSIPPPAKVSIVDSLLESSRRHRSVLVALYFAWFTIPLILASITRPIALWDYLTMANLFNGSAITWANIVPNCVHHTLTNNYIIRPSVCLLFDLQTLLFGGEFWLWYCLKWIAKAVTICFAVISLHRLHCGWTARVAVASLLAFHHSSFTLMLHAPDGWTAFGMLAQIMLIIPVRGDIAKLRISRQLLLVLLMLFTIGAKEVGYVFEGCLLLFLLALHPRNWIRFLPALAILAFWTWRLAAASGRASGFVLEHWLYRFIGESTFLVPGSPIFVLHMLFVAGVVYSWIQAWRLRHEFRGQFIAFCWFCAVAMLVFTTIPNQQIALRYVLPSFYLMSIPFGIVIESLGAARRWVAMFLVFAYPLFTAGSIYRQELGYQYQFFAVNQALWLMDLEAREGAQLAMTGFPGDLGGEAKYTIERYFKEVGSMWYALEKPRQFWIVSEKGWPEKRFVLFSLFHPSQLQQLPSSVKRTRIEHVRALIPGDHGFLEHLTNVYLKIDKALLRRGIYALDTGAPYPGRQAEFYLYTIRGSADPPVLTPPIENIPTGRLPGAF